MLQTRKQITLNGESIIEEEGKQIIVATMFASLSESGKFNNNTTIIDSVKYAEYETEVAADIAEFNAEAIKLLKEG